MYYMYSFVIHLTQVAWSHARRPYVLAMVKVLYNNWGGGGGGGGRVSHFSFNLRGQPQTFFYNESLKNEILCTERCFSSFS